MLPSPRLPLVRGIPSLFRSLGIAAFIAGLLVAYVDAQTMAARRMSLNARVAESRAIEDFVDAATMPAGDEVALTARVAQGAAILVAYRHGLARKTAQVVPLWSTDPSAEPLVLGFAYARNSAPLAVEDAAGGMVRVLGLAEAPGTLSSEVRDTLRAAGLPVVKELLAVRPHLEGREAVLAAPGALSLARGAVLAVRRATGGKLCPECRDLPHSRRAPAHRPGPRLGRAQRAAGGSRTLHAAGGR